MIRFNNDKYKQHYTFIYDFCSSIIGTRMIYLSIEPSESTNCIVFEWVEEYFNNSSDIFDGYKSENDGKYQLNANMYCVAINCTLVTGMNVIRTIYCVYIWSNQVVFQEMTKVYHFMQIIIVLITIKQWNPVHLLCIELFVSLLYLVYGI